MAEPQVRLQRVYGAPARRPREKRVLVDRVWPRGVRKEALDHDLWLREVAPSDALRGWFGHRPERWEEFRARYRQELREGAAREALATLAGLARAGPLTLLFSARDEERNQAVVVRQAVLELLSEK